QWCNRNTPEWAEFLAAMVSSLLPGFLDRYAGHLTPEHQNVCRIYAENVPAYVSLRNDGPRTATHGDSRLDNFLFERNDPEPIVVDWQTAVWSGAALDVA